MTKRVKVRLLAYSVLRETREFEVAAESAETVADVLEQGGTRVPEHPNLKDLVQEKSFLILLNDRLANLTSPVSDGDRVSVMDPFVGG